MVSEQFTGRRYVDFDRMGQIYDGMNQLNATDVTYNVSIGLEAQGVALQVNTS